MAKYRNYEVPSYGTLKKMLGTSVEKFADRPVFHEKIDGAWRMRTYREYGEDVNALGTELLARGFGGKRVIVTGVNCYAWVVTYMAVICGVGVIVPVDKEIPAEELANIAQVSEASLVIYGPKSAEKVEAVDPAIERYSFAKLDELIRSGKRRMAEGDRSYLDAIIDPDVMSALIFTSGTTGVSKGVMLSHHNLCFDIYEARQMLYCGEKDVCLSVLPLHHVYECTVGFLAQLWSGSSVAFSEGVRYISRNMQEVHPTIVLCVPLLLETLYHKLWLNIRKNGLEGKVRAMIKATNAIPGERARMLAKKSVFRAIHKNFGGRLRIMASGGASIDPEILRGLRDLGLLAIQGYGLTECSPIAAVNRDTYYRDSSAGLAMPNVLLDIYDVQDDGTGEIRLRGDNVMLGYYNMPELTEEVKRDGWFYTGDLGYLDADGFLHITGRKKNVIVTANGKNVFPEELETYLCRNPFVAEAVVVDVMNEKKKDLDVVALIYPSRSHFEEIYGKTYTDEQVNAELTRAVDAVNATVQSYKRMVRFVVVAEEFPKNTSRKIKRMGLEKLAEV